MDTDAPFPLECCPPARELPYILRSSVPFLRRLIRRLNIPAGSGMFDFRDLADDEIVPQIFSVLLEHLPRGTAVLVARTPQARFHQVSSSSPSAGHRTPSSSTGAYYSMDNNPMYNAATPVGAPPLPRTAPPAIRVKSSHVEPYEQDSQLHPWHYPAFAAVPATCPQPERRDMQPHKMKAGSAFTCYCCWRRHYR